jgi:hypothetical protein
MYKSFFIRRTLTKQQKMKDQEDLPSNLICSKDCKQIISEQLKSKGFIKSNQAGVTSRISPGI